MQILEHALHLRYHEMSAELVAFIKEVCHKWMASISDGSTNDPPYIKNKVAQVYVYIFVNQYPHTCPTFFADLIGEVTAKGPPMVDIFFRILDAIDEVVVSRERNRSEVNLQVELARNTAIKDAMRVDSLPDIANIWYQCLLSYSDTNPQICDVCIQLITKYVSWVDINLIVNDHILGELYKLIPGNVALRTVACECLRGIILKGMPAASRCQLIETLKLGDSITAWIEGIQEDDENEFAIALGRLYNNTGTLLIEAIDSLKKEDQDISSAWNLLLGLLPRLTDFLGNEWDDISESVMPLVQEYIKFVKKNGVHDEATQQSVAHLAQVIIQKMRYDEEHDFLDEGDDEEAFHTFRKNLGVFCFAPVFEIQPDLVFQLVAQFVQTNLNPDALAAGQVSHLDAELALHVFHELAGMVKCAIFGTQYSCLSINS